VYYAQLAVIPTLRLNPALASRPFAARRSRAVLRAFAVRRLERSGHAAWQWRSLYPSPNLPPDGNAEQGFWCPPSSAPFVGAGLAHDGGDAGGFSLGGLGRLERGAGAVGAGFAGLAGGGGFLALGFCGGARHWVSLAVGLLEGHNATNRPTWASAIFPKQCDRLAVVPHLKGKAPNAGPYVLAI